jgi:hypothetical protein
MGNKMKIAKLILLFIISLVFLTACGGESLSRDQDAAVIPVEETNNPNSQAITIAMSIVDQQGNEQTQLVEGAPLNVNTLVVDASGSPLSGQVVMYILDQNDLAVFNNDTATALTNSDGVATIQMSVGVLSGSGTITATVNSSEVVILGFSSLGSTSDGTDQPTPELITITMSILDQQGNEETQLAEGAPLNINTLVLDASGSPITGKLVKYTLSQENLATFNNDTASGLTNSDGISTIQMAVGTLTGSGTVTASLAGTESVELGFASLGSTSGSPNMPAPVLTIAMSLIDQQGSEQTQLAQGEPLNVNTLVLDAEGNPVSGQLVTYTLSQENLGTFNNDTATGLTNSDGIATIQMAVGSFSGSGTVTAMLASSESVVLGFSSLGSTSGGPGGPAPVLTVAMSLIDEQGSEQTQLADGAPLDANTLVLDASGNPVVGQVVTYTLNQSDLATFNNDTATALTNSDGIATIQMAVGALSGSGTITASLASSESIALGFTSLGSDEINEPTPALSIAMSLLDQQGNEQTQLAEGAPLNVNTLVLDAFGEPLSGQVVTYSLSQDDLATFNNDTATGLTNGDGIATIQMTVGTLSGSGTVTASLASSESIVLGFTSLGTLQATPSSIELYADAVQLASSGGDEIELIALVKNEQNILLPNIAISFSVDQNASLSSIDPQTGPDGTARAILSTQNYKQNRTITVIATSAALSQELQIKVVGTEVNINGASSVIVNDTAPITIVLSDSDGTGIANQVVSLSATLGLVNNPAPVTGANGQVTVDFSANQSGTAIISATALNTSTNFTIIIQQDDFSFDAVPTQSLALNSEQVLQLSWFKNSVPFANGDVTVTASRGVISADGTACDDSLASAQNTTTTDANGIARVNICSEFAGPASVSAIGIDANGNEVTARAAVEFVASDVDSIFVDATPDLIGPEGQTTTITAVLRDAKGNLVKGKTVNFRLDIDSSGGSISPNTAITDSNGIASSVYTSNAVSGDKGVTVSAQSDNVIGTTELTVGDRAFDISLGTGGSIQIPDSSSYLKEFAVFVTDASGRPVANAELTSTVTPTGPAAFKKGRWAWDPDLNIYFEYFDSNEPNYLADRTCSNEDADKDGILDITPVSEDINQDGFLTPGNVASVSFKGNISRTNEFGQATLQVRYPKQFGNWADVVVSVFGQSAGSESMQSQVYSLSVARDDLTLLGAPPPHSPFGLAAGCSNTN